MYRALYRAFRALPAVLLSLATLLGVREAAAAELGRKLFENKTDQIIVLDLAIRASDGLPFLNTAGRTTFGLYPSQMQWRSYDGTYLNSVTVDGGVRCEVKSTQRGDWADTLLNTNMGLTIEKQGSGCTIRGYNPS